MRASAAAQEALTLGRAVVSRIPRLFIAVAAAALACQCLPGSRAALLYDRTALASGQWWRLWSGHLVHFGWPHFVADTGLWLILGYLLGRGRTLAFSVVVLLLPVAISGAIYVFSPTMLRYGGLSAVDLCLLLFVAGRGWQHDWRDWFWPAVLIIYVGEIVFEATLGQGHGGGMIRFDDPGVQVATSAHIAAAVYAVPMWIFSRTFEKQAK